LAFPYALFVESWTRVSIGAGRLRVTVPVTVAPGGGVRVKVTLWIGSGTTAAMFTLKVSPALSVAGHAPIVEPSPLQPPGVDCGVHQLS
jgi:hypothetical protein